MDKKVALMGANMYKANMVKQPRKYIKTKFEGVFYRFSTRREPRTSEFDRVYCFWYADAEGKGHWKTVGRHSKGERPQTARQAGQNSWPSWPEAQP